MHWLTWEVFIKAFILWKLNSIFFSFLFSFSLHLSFARILHNYCDKRLNVQCSNFGIHICFSNCIDSEYRINKYWKFAKSEYINQINNSEMIIILDFESFCHFHNSFLMTWQSNDWIFIEFFLTFSFRGYKMNLFLGLKFRHQTTRSHHVHARSNWTA